MAKITLSIPDYLNEKIRDYCEIRKMNLSTFYTIATENYMREIEFNEKLSTVLTDEVKKIMAIKQKEQRSK
jgi:hypothetical protein